MALFDYELPHPVAVGYRKKPVRNVMVNVGTDKKPAYAEFTVYPAYPWALAELRQSGDGRGSKYTPAGEPASHAGEDARAFWNLAASVGAIPLPTEADKSRFTNEDG